MPRSFDDDLLWFEYPFIQGFGSTHDMASAEPEIRKSRLWDLRSTSKAACAAYDQKPKGHVSRKVGFAHRRPK